MRKELFLNKLNWYLSFYLRNEDRINIVDDYEEWFEKEMESGKTEEELCHSLKSPQAVASRIYHETCNENPFKLLVQSHFIKNSIVLCVNLIIVKYVLSFCNTSSFHYLFPALILLLAFMIQMSLINRDLNILYNNFLPVLCIPLGCQFLLFIYRVVGSNLVKSYTDGILYNQLFNILLLIMIASFLLVTIIKKDPAILVFSYYCIYSCLLVSGLFSNLSGILTTDYDAYFNRMILGGGTLLIASASLYLLLLRTISRKSI